MEVKEMHIHFEQRLQKMSANKTRKLMSEEIDSLLNLMVDRKLRQSIKPRPGEFQRFEVEQTEVDLVRNHLVERPLKPFYDPANGYYFVDLPSNYWFLLDDAASWVKKCTGNYQFGSSPYLVYFLPFPKSTSPTGPYYQDVSITYVIGANPAVTVFSMLEEHPEHLGYPSKDQRYEIVNRVMATETEEILYWEESSAAFRRNGFLVITTDPTRVYSIKSGASTTAGTKILDTAYTTYTPLAAVRTTPNREMNHSLNSHLLNTPYYTPGEDSFLSRIMQQRLQVYAPKSCIVTSLTMVYLRKPRKISLNLNEHCDLPDVFHNDVVDMAVEHAYNMLLSPAWPTVVQENQQRGTIA